MRKAPSEFEARAGFWVRVVRDVGFPITVAIVLLAFILGGLLPKFEQGLVILEQIADMQREVVEQHEREITLLLQLVHQLGGVQQPRNWRPPMRPFPWSAPARSRSYGSNGSSRIHRA